jgi:hypothetical protein
VSQRCGTLSVVAPALRLPLALALAAALAAPAANAATPTATTAAPSVQTTTPQPAPGGAFGPLQPLASDPVETEPTVTSAKRPDDGALGRSTLLLLSIVSLALIFAVIALIVYEGRKTGGARKRRKRLRSGRTPQPATAGAQGRRSPPPPPRKRRAQAKRKKR